MACIRGWHRTAMVIFMSACQALDLSEDNPYTELQRQPCFEQSPGTVDRSGTTLIIGRRNWLSAELATEVFYILMKEIMNYDVKLLDLSSASSTKTWGQDMEAGYMDFEMESWQAGSSTSWYLEYVIQKQIVSVGNIGYGGRSGLFTTPTALRKHPFADFYIFYKESDLLKDAGYVMFGEEVGINAVKSVLGDSYPFCVESDFPFCGAAGSQFENYYVPPQCTSSPEDCALAIMAWPSYDKAFFEQLTTNYGLKLIHTWASGDVEGAVNQIIAAGREVTFYWWVPDPFPARVNASRISFPDNTFGCTAGDTQDPSGPVACDYPSLELAKLARTALRTEAPEAFYVWENTEIYAHQTDQMISWTTNAGGTLSAHESACKWLKENPDVIDRWAPPCVSSPNPFPKNGESIFDPYLLTCKVAARFPETELMETCFDPRPGTVDRSDQLVRMAKRGWASQILANDVASLILKEFLGYKVFTVDATATSTSDWGPDMEGGGFDADVESWQASPSSSAYLEYVIRKQVVLNPGPIGYTGRSGLFMFPAALEVSLFTTYWRYYTDQLMIDQSKFVAFPGAPELPDLKTTLGDDFPACTQSWCPDSTSEFEGYYVPPICQNDPEKCLLVVHATATYDSAYFEQLTNNLGMRLVYAYYGGSHFNKVILDYFEAKRDDLLFYMWEPDTLISSTQAVRMSFPDHAYACDSGNTKEPTGPVKCDYGEFDLQKIIRAELTRTAPEAYMFLKNFQLLKDDIDLMLRNTPDATGPGGPFNSTFQVACWWAKNNEQRIRLNFAPDCISRPKPLNELRDGDQIFDAATFSCPPMNCRADQVLEVKGAVSCRTCPPGQVPNKNGTDCEVCQVGHVPDRNTGLCKECPLGHFCPFGNEYADQCTPGTFASMTQMTECVRCEKGTYQNLPGRWICESCPSPMTTSVFAASRAAECICPESYYKPKNVTGPDGHPWVENSTVCLECPAGLICEEGSDQSNMPCRGSVRVSMDNRTENELSRLYPIPPPKFYTTCEDMEGLSCYKCLTELACPGLDVGECAEGTEGIACGRCKDGYYKSDEVCMKCNDVEASSVIFPILPICVAPCILVGLYLVSRDRLDKWNSPANYLASALFIVLVYIQTLAAISACYLAKPKAMTESSEWTAYAFELLSLFRPSCTTFTSFQVSFIGQLLLPVYAVVFCIFVWLCSVIVGLVRRRFRMDGDIMTNCYLSLFNTFFIGIAQQTFTLFQCYRHPNEEMSMRSQADVLCNSPDWNDLVAVAIVAVVVFCGGFLSLNIYAVAVAPRKFSNPRFQIRWKFVFIKYRPSAWWWGLVMLVKGIWLNMPTVVFDTGSSQMIWLQGILVAYFALVYGVLPWRSFLVGMLDVTQHAFLIFLFGFVPHFIPADEPDADEKIGTAYAFFSMCPLLFGAMVAFILLLKRCNPRITQSDWHSSAEEVCSTFCQVDDPKMLAKILSQLPWTDIMSINTTRNIVRTTYLFERHPKSLMAKSPLLSYSTTTRLQAETEISDYMGADYSSPKKAVSREEENTKDGVPEPEAEHQDDQISVPKGSKSEFTSADLLDALDFPPEQMDGMHVMSDMIGLLTPRFEAVAVPRTPRSQAATPVATPREDRTPVEEKTLEVSTPRVLKEEEEENEEVSDTPRTPR